MPSYHVDLEWRWMPPSMGLQGVAWTIACIITLECRAAWLVSVWFQISNSDHLIQDCQTNPPRVTAILRMSTKQGLPAGTLHNKKHFIFTGSSNLSPQLAHKPKLFNKTDCFSQCVLWDKKGNNPSTYQTLSPLLFPEYFYSPFEPSQDDKLTSWRPEDGVGSPPLQGGYRQR